MTVVLCVVLSMLCAPVTRAPCSQSQVVLTEALRERHMGYLQGLRWDDAVDKSPDSLHIVKVIEGSDPDSRNQELPVSTHARPESSALCALSV